MSGKFGGSAVADPPRAYAAPVTFSVWRDRLSARGLQPVILVAGSRGKSTVVRLLDSMLREAGLRTATWTDYGVEVEGARQDGEFHPWSGVLERLATGSLDIALREVEWSTVRTAGLRRQSFPLVIVTNVCANHEACLIQGEAKLAQQMLPDLLSAASMDGVVLLNGEDYAVAGAEIGHGRPQWLIALNRDTPLVREHLKHGGHGAWLEQDVLVVNTGIDQPIDEAKELRFALGGAAGFQIQNALTAAAAARAVGIEIEPISTALRGFRPSHRTMPGSFNIFDVSGATVIVDRPEPSWFLRPILRATRDRGNGRLMTVAGALDHLPDSDLGEVGRLLGRASSAILLPATEERSVRGIAFRHGVALNHVPPPIIHTPSEGRAISRALAMARPRDIVLIFTDRPQAAFRTLLRARKPAARPLLAAD